MLIVLQCNSHFVYVLMCCTETLAAVPVPTVPVRSPPRTSRSRSVCWWSWLSREAPWDTSCLRCCCCSTSGTTGQWSLDIGVQIGNVLSLSTVKPVLGMITMKNHAAVHACACAWDVQCGSHSLTKLHWCCEASLHFEYFIRVFFLPFWLQSPSLWQPSEQQPAGGAPHPTVAALWEHPQLQVTDPQTLPPLGWCKAMLLRNLPPTSPSIRKWYLLCGSDNNIGWCKVNAYQEIVHVSFSQH